MGCAHILYETSWTRYKSSQRWKPEEYVVHSYCRVIYVPFALKKQGPLFLEKKSGLVLRGGVRQCMAATHKNIGRKSLLRRFSAKFRRNSGLV